MSDAGNGGNGAAIGGNGGASMTISGSRSANNATLADVGGLT